MLRPLALSLIIHIIPVGLSLISLQIEPEVPLEPEPAAVAESGQEALLASAPISITILEEATETLTPKPEPAQRPKKREAPKPREAEPAPEPVAETAPEQSPEEAQQEQAMTEAVAAAVAAPAVETTPAPVDTCPPDPEGVVALGPASWSVDRDLVEFYALHIKELMKIAWVGTHKNEQGDPDGFRVVLRQCSILRNGGLQSHDVIVDVGGVKVHSITTAIKAYFKLRKQEIINLKVRRAGETLDLSYTLAD